LDHVKNIVGADHTGIGSDYQERGAYVPGELNKPETYRLIEKRLRAKGYSEKEIRGIMGTNFLRALGISY
jgi:microsomal dipeptidase-like Zn-dependent dipeptidase